MNIHFTEKVSQTKAKNTAFRFFDRMRSDAEGMTNFLLSRDFVGTRKKITRSKKFFEFLVKNFTTYVVVDVDTGEIVKEDEKKLARLMAGSPGRYHVMVPFHPVGAKERKFCYVMRYIFEKTGVSPYISRFVISSHMVERFLYRAETTQVQLALEEVLQMHLEIDLKTAVLLREFKIDGDLEDERDNLVNTKNGFVILRPNSDVSIPTHGVRIGYELITWLPERLRGNKQAIHTDLRTVLEKNRELLSTDLEDVAVKLKSQELELGLAKERLNIA
ncbi:hypothetical protein [Photobacterium leiognathi]|uniref:hypothetical protein n=1 Tax=Photobacterium leiognathi TaxID=553611 RepID=UPI0029818599|nr:hypothetical protein [Photobacterium leiognathi]